MMKKMKSHDKSDSQAPEKRAERSPETIQSSKTFFAEINAISTQHVSLSLSYIDYAETLLNGHGTSIFHPPQA